VARVLWYQWRRDEHQFSILGIARIFFVIRTGAMSEPLECVVLIGRVYGSGHAVVLLMWGKTVLPDPSVLVQLLALVAVWTLVLGV